MGSSGTPFRGFANRRCAYIKIPRFRRLADGGFLYVGLKHFSLRENACPVTRHRRIDLGLKPFLEGARKEAFADDEEDNPSDKKRDAEYAERSMNKQERGARGIADADDERGPYDNRSDVGGKELFHTELKKPCAGEKKMPDAIGELRDEQGAKWSCGKMGVEWRGDAISKLADKTKAREAKAEEIPKGIADQCAA